MSQLTAEDLVGCCKSPDEVQEVEFRENLEINASLTPGSRISRVLSVATENQVMDSILK